MSSLFGFAKSTEDSKVSGLFGKPSQLNNKQLAANKIRTVLDIPKGEDSNEDEMDIDSNEGQKGEEQETTPIPEQKTKKHKKKSKDENDDLEDRYIGKLLEEETKEAKKEESDNESDSVDDEADKESKPSAGNGKAKILDLKDEELEKAERTIFVGNLPASVIATKKATKDFKKFIKSQVSDAAIQSIRFRSINLNSTLPKKLAYISKSYEEGGQDAVNSYIVFKEKADSLTAVKLNGTIYLGNHIRVDHLTHPLPKNNKLCVFVGNLDFEEKEESLYRFFNKQLEEENCVSNVRIIRDSKTNFGKGFAIVQFTDSNFVEKALLLNGKKLEGSKKPRNLRISRCKNQTNTSNNQSGKNYKNLSDKQKTAIGRGKKVLSKSDRQTIGKMVIEGERSKKGGNVKGIKVGGSIGKMKKKPRSATGRAAKRSQAFKAKLLSEKK